MSYLPTEKLRYASGKVHICDEYDGTYRYIGDVSDEFKKRFEKDWQERMKEIDELRKKGYIIPYSL